MPVPTHGSANGMQLFWGPHTCAIGIHILLLEAGAPFEAIRLDLRGGEHRREPFRTLNPKMRVPVLVRDDGAVLTEFGAIATWIALAYPRAGLLPQAPDDRVRMIAIMDYCVGTLHGQAFRRVFRPADFVPKTLAGGAEPFTAGIAAEGLEMAKASFAVLDRDLGVRPHVGGQSFSIGDAALFYCARWASRIDLALPPNVAAHLERTRARQSVREALAVYGET